MADFELISEFKPTGDQPQAIDQLVRGITSGRCAIGKEATPGWGWGIAADDR